MKCLWPSGLARETTILEVTGLILTRRYSLFPNTATPLRATPNGGSARRSARTGPARLSTSAGTRRGAATTPALLVTGPVADGRPSRVAAPLPPVATATIAGRAGPAAVPTCGTTPCGRRPARAMVAAIWPPAVKSPRGPPTAARAAMAALAANATGDRSTSLPALLRRPPVRAPCEVSSCWVDALLSSRAV